MPFGSSRLALQPFPTHSLVAPDTCNRLAFHPGGKSLLLRPRCGVLIVARIVAFLSPAPSAWPAILMPKALQAIFSRKALMTRSRLFAWALHQGAGNQHDGYQGFWGGGYMI